VSRKNGGLYPKRCCGFDKGRKSDSAREIILGHFLRLLRLIRINLMLLQISRHTLRSRRLQSPSRPNSRRRDQVDIKLRPFHDEVNSAIGNIRGQTVFQIHLVFICADIFPWFHAVFDAPFDIQEFTLRHWPRGIPSWKHLPEGNHFCISVGTKLPAAPILIVEHLCIRAVMKRIKTERMHRMLIRNSHRCAGCQPKWDHANTEPDEQTPEWYFLH